MKAVDLRALERKPIDPVLEIHPTEIVAAVFNRMPLFQF